MTGANDNNVLFDDSNGALISQSEYEQVMAYLNRRRNQQVIAHVIKAYMWLGYVTLLLLMFASVSL